MEGIEERELEEMGALLYISLPAVLTEWRQIPEEG